MGDITLVGANDAVDGDVTSALKFNKNLFNPAAPAKSFAELNGSTRIQAGAALPPPTPVFPRYVEPEAEGDAKAQPKAQPKTKPPKSAPKPGA